MGNIDDNNVTTPTPEPQKPSPAPEPEGNQPGPVPYDRFKQVNDELKTMRDRMAKIEADKKTADEERLKKQEEWQKLAEQREAELKDERLKRTRLEIATQKGIPADLAGRLQGETAEEMEKDADALLAFLKPATGPGVPPAGPGRGKKPVDLDNMTAEQVREAAKGKAIRELIGE